MGDLSSLTISVDLAGGTFAVAYDVTAGNAYGWDVPMGPVIGLGPLRGDFDQAAVPPSLGVGPDTGVPATEAIYTQPYARLLAVYGPGVGGLYPTNYAPTLWAHAPSQTSSMWALSEDGGAEYYTPPQIADDVPPSPVKDVEKVYHGTEGYKATYLKVTEDPITEADAEAAFERRYPGETHEMLGDRTNGYVIFNREARHLIFVKGTRYIAMPKELSGWEVDKDEKIMIWHYGGLQGREHLESRMSERPNAGNTAVIQKAVDAMMNSGLTLAELIEADRRMVDGFLQPAIAAIDEDEVRRKQQLAVDEATSKLVGTSEYLSEEKEAEIRAKVRKVIEAEVKWRVLVETQAQRVLSGALEVAMETELLAIVNDLGGEQIPVGQDELNEGTWEMSTDQASGPADVLARLARVTRGAEAEVLEAFANSEAAAGRASDGKTAAVVSLSNPWTGTHRGTRVNTRTKSKYAEYVASLIGAWGSGGWIDRFNPVAMDAEIRLAQARREGFASVEEMMRGTDPGVLWDVQSAQINLGWALYFNPETRRYEVNERIGHGFKSFMSSIFGAVFKIAGMSGGYTKGFYPEVTDPRTGKKVRPAGYREVVHNGMRTAGWQAKPGTEAEEFDRLLQVLTGGTVDRVARGSYYELGPDGVPNAIMHNVARDRTEEVKVDAPGFKSEPSGRGEITAPGNALQWSKGALTALSQVLGFMFHEHALREEGSDFYDYMNELIVASGGEAMSHGDMYGQEGQRQENIVDDYNFHGSGSEMSQNMLVKFGQMLSGTAARNIPALRELLPIARGLVDALKEESTTLAEYAQTAKGNFGLAVKHDLYESRRLNGRQAFEDYKAIYEAELRFSEGHDLATLAKLTPEQMQVLLEGNGEIARAGLLEYQALLVNLSDSEKAALLDGTAKGNLPTLLAKRKQLWQERKRGYHFNADDVEIPAEYADGVA